MGTKYSYQDLQSAGLILACKHRKCRITGKPLYDSDFVNWAKAVMAYFGREAWRYLRRIKTTLKAAWAKILQTAKDLDRINEARRKARQIDKARKPAKQVSFSFRPSVAPIVAQYGQTGRQLQEGKEARERFNEFPTMKTKISRYYVK